VEETFESLPNAKWYVFIETDTYVFFPNLAHFLSRLSPTVPYYLGSAALMGPTVFAHGGSGYILSASAMNQLLAPEMKTSLAASWDERMKEHCCGDVALAVALKEKGVEMRTAGRAINGEKPATLDYGPGGHWCQAVVTMHHVLPSEVSAVWRYERRREVLGWGENVSACQNWAG
jgi:hypothetical protein